MMRNKELTGHAGYRIKALYLAFSGFFFANPI